SLDQTRLIPDCMRALEKGEPVSLEYQIRNIHRTVGTILGSELTRRFGGEGLPDGTISLKFSGTAGQSFGAFLPRGMTLTLEGDANDYIGKGLSGGRMIAFPPKTARFGAEDNVLIGNVALYGGTGGRAFFRGRAGERFAVRNSGVSAVVEGTGDHCCEYMTGGVVLVIGPTGRNFAAGMSGGRAFVFDEWDDFAQRCNLEMVDLERLAEPQDLELVRDLLIPPARYTGSRVAARLLNDWDWATTKFVKVMPLDYRRVLEEQRAAARDRSPHDALDPVEVSRG